MPTPNPDHHNTPSVSMPVTEDLGSGSTWLGVRGYGLGVSGDELGVTGLGFGDRGPGSGFGVGARVWG